MKKPVGIASLRDGEVVVICEDGGTYLGFLHQERFNWKPIAPLPGSYQDKARKQDGK